jgi:outer membrane protein OmpA-like peptidoglycan-associated protein
MAGTCALALQVPTQPLTSSREPEKMEVSFRASIDFDGTQLVPDDEDLRSIEAIARAARDSPLPVAIAAFTSPSGNAGQGLVLARKRATRVREALVMAGIPRVRVIIVSPTFSAHDEERVEVSLVRGVRAFESDTRQPDTIRLPVANKNNGL